MTWQTPTLKELRSRNRDYIVGALPGADAMVPNSVLRVMSDANAGLAHLNLQFLAWLAKNLLPDTAETAWLDRWANMFLVNADNSKGRKQAAFATGMIKVGQLGGLPGVIVPNGSILSASNLVTYQMTDDGTIGSDGTTIVPVIALQSGVIGNQLEGASLRFTTAITSLSASASVVLIDGGTDVESDDELRIRVLERLAQPPMGGDAEDYVAWALKVPGVTRAWAAPNEMGIGTVTIRFMMDDLRADQGGFPTGDDLNTVRAYLDLVRPVTVKDFFVEAPVPEPINFTVKNLNPDTVNTWAALTTSVNNMLRERARPAFSLNGVLQPAETIYEAWVSDAISQAPDVISFKLIMDDHIMPYNGSLAVLGSVNHG